jgi:hypothetical protein
MTTTNKRADSNATIKEKFESLFVAEEIESERPVFIRGRVPESVRARFKAACALRGQDMGEVLGEMIMKWLEEHEPSPLSVRKKTTAAEPTAAAKAKGKTGKS